jgi:hypothetical protein
VTQRHNSKTDLKQFQAEDKSKAYARPRPNEPKLDDSVCHCRGDQSDNAKPTVNEGDGERRPYQVKCCGVHLSEQALGDPTTEHKRPAVRHVARLESGGECAVSDLHQ